jgi:homoserine/homoserine lactone efflux protein
MRTEAIIGFATLIGIATCSPGPNVLAVISQALRHGLRGAALAILGNLLALLLVASAAAFGIGGLIKAFPDAFTVMKLAGALYLIWVGWSALRASFGPAAGAVPEDGPDAGEAAIVLKTLLISLSNPKSVLFLSAVFPTFLDPSAAIAPQFAIMFAIIIAIVGAVHSSYAFVALRMRSRLISQAGKRWTQRIAGLSFAGLGLGLLVDAARTR